MEEGGVTLDRLLTNVSHRFVVRRPAVCHSAGRVISKAIRVTKGCLVTLQLVVLDSKCSPAPSCCPFFL